MLKNISGITLFREPLSLLCAVVLGLVALSFSFIGQSLWLDECISAWIIKDSLGQVFERAWTYQGQSPFYFAILWFLQHAIGNSELALRSLSLVCLILSAWGIYRLAREIADREYAGFSTLIFVMFPGTLWALSARPYALGLCCIIWSTFWLLRWARQDRSLWLMAWLVLSLMTFYAHYIFGGIILVQFILLLSQRRYWWHRRVGLLIALIVLCALAAPGLIQLGNLGQRHETLYIAAKPGVTQLVKALFPPVVSIILLVSFAVGLLLGRGRLVNQNLRLPQHISWIGAWWLLPPVLLFGYSVIGQHSLFLTRYFLWYLPGAALVFAALIRALESASARRFAAASLLLLAAYFETQREWRLEDWKSGIALADKIRGSQPWPMLLYTGLIEARDVRWFTEPEKSSYLLAPLHYYSTKGSALAMPPNPSQVDANHYLSGTVLPQIRAAHGAVFVLLNRDASTKGSKVSDLYQQYFLRQGLVTQVFNADELVTVMRVNCLPEACPKL